MECKNMEYTSLLRSFPGDSLSRRNFFLVSKLRDQEKQKCKSYEKLQPKKPKKVTSTMGSTFNA